MDFMKKNKPGGTSFQDSMLKLVRTLPKVLKYLPGDKAADAPALDEPRREVAVAELLLEEAEVCDEVLPAGNAPDALIHICNADRAVHAEPARAVVDEQHVAAPDVADEEVQITIPVHVAHRQCVGVGAARVHKASVRWHPSTWAARRNHLRTWSPRGRSRWS